MGLKYSGQMSLYTSRKRNEREIASVGSSNPNIDGEEEDYVVSEDSYGQRERFETESEVVLTSIDDLPSNFDCRQHGTNHSKHSGGQRLSGFSLW